MSALTNLLSSDGYIIVNKTLIKKIGLYEAILLGELCAEYSHWEAEGKLVDGMFYSTRENIEANTGFTSYIQREAMKKLQALGILEIVRKGLPATNYYSINEDNLLSCLAGSSENIKHLNTEQFNVNNNKQKVISKKVISNTISKDIVNSQKPLIDTDYVNTIIELYHKHCPNLPKVRCVTDSRKKAIQKIAKKYKQEDIVRVFDIANSNQFLIGDNDRGWKADIDFLLREDKFVKILEGGYASTNTAKDARVRIERKDPNNLPVYDEEKQRALKARIKAGGEGLERI